MLLLLYFSLLVSYFHGPMKGGKQGCGLHYWEGEIKHNFSSNPTFGSQVLGSSGRCEHHPALHTYTRYNAQRKLKATPPCPMSPKRTKEEEGWWGCTFTGASQWVVCSVFFVFTVAHKEAWYSWSVYIGQVLADSSSWPQTIYPSSLASWVLGLWACATTPCVKWISLL